MMEHLNFDGQNQFDIRKLRIEQSDSHVAGGILTLHIALLVDNDIMTFSVNCD